MRYRKFGSLDWQVSALGFGAMRLPTRGCESAVDEPIGPALEGLVERDPLVAPPSCHHMGGTTIPWRSRRTARWRSSARAVTAT